MNFSTKVEGFKLICKMLIVLGNRIAQNKRVQNLEAEILYTIVATRRLINAALNIATQNMTS